MANPTTNFGWVMPTSTSLVTNLPADFNTFGQGVDTSMAQLKGGTTGQILSKTSATDMAFTWITNDVGDITAVTAGTGISGGGTSGAVTITNSMATEITAKGDLIAGTGSATFDNLPVGTNGQTLVADSTASTGLKWATPASGGGMTLLSTTTLSGSTTTISSISGSYNQLCIQVFDAYGSSGGGTTGRFNGDATAAAYQEYFAEPSAGTVYPTATPWYYSTATSYSWTTGSLKAADTNFFMQILLPNYADTTSRKMVSVLAAFENAGSNNSLNANYGFWNNTAAITSLTFTAPGGGTWTQGTVKIWGIL